MSEDPYIEELLSVDPLALAERLTGKSYKADDTTSNLGLALALHLNERKAAALKVRGDTSFETPFLATLQIAHELGFTTSYVQLFQGREVQERYAVLWRNGILMVLESYAGTRVNNLQLYFDFKYSDSDKLWSIPMSSYPISDQDGIRGCHLVVREGLRMRLDQLENAGEFVVPWVSDRKNLWLTNYATVRENHTNELSEVVDWYLGNTAKIVAQFPDEVKRGIGLDVSS